MRRSMSPHGDRRDGAESSRIKDEKSRAAPFNDHVVRVLVLGQDFGDLARRRLSPEPVEDVTEGSFGPQLLLEPLELRVRYRLCRRNGNVPHSFIAGLVPQCKREGPCQSAAINRMPTSAYAAAISASSADSSTESRA